MTTLKQRIEAIRDRHHIPSGNWRVEFCFTCGKQFPCPDRADAEAALAILNFKLLPEDEEKA